MHTATLSEWGPMDAVTDEEFERWYRSYYPKLVNSLRCYLGDSQLAKVAADEAIVRAYEKRSTVFTMPCPEAWTYRVAVNWGKRRLSRRKLERLVTLRNGRRNEPQPSGEIWQVVAQLPPRQREAVALRHLGQLSEAQVAEAMQIKRGTVSATLTQAYKSLRAQISYELPEQMEYSE